MSTPIATDSVVLVRDVMTAPAITVGPDAPYGEIVHRLLANDISGLPVVDDSGRLLGVVTETDLVVKEAYGGRGRRALDVVREVIQGHPSSWVPKVMGRTARELMTADVVVAQLDDDVALAGRLMLRRRCNRLPVVHAGRVVGIVSRQDLLRRFDRADREVSIDVGQVISARGAGCAGVSFEVNTGVVLLRGLIDSDAEARVLRQAVAGIDGVIDVDDHLALRSACPTVRG